MPSKSHPMKRRSTRMAEALGESKNAKSPKDDPKAEQKQEPKDDPKAKTSK